MGKITSASTIYATAYLTEKGRQYLFNKGNIRFDSNGNDLLAITTFALSDGDTNYNTSARLVSGDIPDITGKSDNCIKATADYKQSTFIYQQADAVSLADPFYSTDAPENILLLNVEDASAFPASQSSDVPPTSSTPSGGQNTNSNLQTQ